MIPTSTPPAAGWNQSVFFGNFKNRARIQSSNLVNATETNPPKIPSTA